MQEIKCPKCGEVFQVDESGYAAIVKQVRDKEFLKEIEQREQAIVSEKKLAIDLAVQHTASEKDAIIADLQARLRAGATDKEAALREASARQQLEMTRKDAEIAQLRTQLQSSEKDAQLAVQTAVEQKNATIMALQQTIEKEKLTAQLNGRSIQEQHQRELALKDEQIAYYRDFKARQSTKMIGESLEQHCLTEFNRIRATAFRNAYFEKDNDARTGSKGVGAGLEFGSTLGQLSGTGGKNRSAVSELACACLQCACALRELAVAAGQLVCSGSELACAGLQGGGSRAQGGQAVHQG